MDSRIIPLNLPARAQKEIAGNPAISRLESATANCFPGLEIDHRNLDRRFFPGLIFNFIFDSDAINLGARLVAIDLGDLNSPEEKQLTAPLQELQTALSQGQQIFLHSLRQNSNETINLWQEPNRPLSGLIVWRLIRCLSPELVIIALAKRDQSRIGFVYPEIAARRRSYQTKDGTLAAVYQPGELSQSLCSPWQHDFRDCSCNYWASNRPDIVLAGDPDAKPEVSGNIFDSDEADRMLLWLRWNQSKPVAPHPTRVECRPFEMDHYEINERWQDLPMVLEGRERRVPYAPGPIVAAAPFENQDKLTERLRDLAGMEHALALEYLYARYSVKMGDSTDPQAQDHADYIAHELLIIATSEMMHLRWVNQLLWELWHGSHIEDFEPQLQVATHVPGHNGPRPVSMRPLDQAINDFIAAEAASGTIEGAYARVLATLREGYSPSLAELSSRIIADGVSHFTRFREIKAILRQHDRETLVREITPSSATAPELRKVKSLYEGLIGHLKIAYRVGHADDRGEIATARKIMMELDAAAIELASREVPIGIPFSELLRDRQIIEQ